jgi:hypothetical protein
LATLYFGFAEKVVFDKGRGEEAGSRGKTRLYFLKTLR